MISPCCMHSTKSPGFLCIPQYGVHKPATPDGLYALNYSDFVVPLAKAVQELSKVIDEKDAKINSLETRLTKLEAVVNIQPSVPNIKSQTTN